MAFSIPAKYQEKRKHLLSKEAAHQIAISVVEKMKLLKIGYLKSDETKEVLDYRTRGTTLLTFSERVKIYIGDTEILVKSVCLFPGQFLDFGKNKKNVTTFFDLFEKEKLQK